MPNPPLGHFRLSVLGVTGTMGIGCALGGCGGTFARETDSDANAAPSIEDARFETVVDALIVGRRDPRAASHPKIEE